MWNFFMSRYRPLSFSDTIDEDETLFIKEVPIYPTRWKSYALLYFLVGLVPMLLFFAAGYAVAKFEGIERTTKQFDVTAKPTRPDDDDLDAHGGLTVSNTTRIFEIHPEYVLDSNFANAYWLGIQPSGGLVSINTERAFNHGLPPSLPSPAKPDESIYQVAVYHSLHCLNRLRHRIFALPNPSSPYPPIESDHHTIHCVDHLRQALTCKTDVSLGATEDYDSWGLKLQHHCQDYDAVMGWVERHALEGLPEVLDGVRSRKMDE